MLVVALEPRASPTLGGCWTTELRPSYNGKCVINLDFINIHMRIHTESDQDTRGMPKLQKTDRVNITLLLMPSESSRRLQKVVSL